MSEITLHNVGPIDRINLPISPEGGVVVLKGRNGCGKSTALDAVSTLVSGRGSLPSLRDGQKTGEVFGFGSRINLAISANRRAGNQAELVVDSVEGKFSIADLVDPSIKEPKAADKARLKALITLLGVNATPELFHPLFESKEVFDSHVSKSSTETSDPILMAERVKRDIEEKARIEEDRAKLTFAEHNAKINGTEFDPGDIITDFDAHNAEHDAAVRRHTELVTAKTNFLKTKASLDRAKAAIATVNVGVKETELEGEQALTDARKMEIESRVENVKRIHAELSRLQSELDVENRNIDALHDANRQSQRVMDSIRSELESLSGYREIVEQSKSLAEIDRAEIDAASVCVNEIRDRLRKHTIASENKRKRETAETILKRAESINENAANLRRAAKQVDAVLTELIGVDSPLRIVDNRMVVNTNRGETFYSDLSDGERWRVAFDVVSNHVHRDPNKLALIVIPQIGWESLDPINQDMVCSLAKKHRINVITAEATDGPLTPSVV